MAVLAFFRPQSAATPSASNWDVVSCSNGEVEDDVLLYLEVAFETLHDAEEDLGFAGRESDGLGGGLVAGFVGHFAGDVGRTLVW